MSGSPRIAPIDNVAGQVAAVEALRRREIIAFPTDTLYGVGGDALSPEAAERVVRAKGRDPGKGFPVLLADLGEVGRLAAAWPPEAVLLAARFWPGALTIVVPALPGLPEQVVTGDTVALRVPGHAALRAIIRHAGCPLIGTSANRSGQPAALTALEAAGALGVAVALVLDGGRTNGHPSSIVACLGGDVRLVREGAISAALIKAVVGAMRFHPTE